MQGLELAKAYFEEFGRPMLERFPDLLPHLSAGVLGSGSEWLRFDDETSRDHDFGPGFLLFLPGEDVVSRRDEFLLERAYAALPEEFQGVRRKKLSPVGGNRFGVHRLSEFLKEHLGTEDGVLSTEDFLRIPEQYLLEMTNGEIFFDGSGALTRIRERLKAFPEDVRLKKLAGSLVLLGQAAPYNFERCLSHGETAAASLALLEFVEAALHIAFLLNRRYMPFYKWRFRALRLLPAISERMTPEELAAELEFLMTHENTGNALAEKRECIAYVTAELGCAVRVKLEQEGFRFPGERTYAAANPYRLFGVLSGTGGNDETDLDPGKLAETVNGFIQDAALRNAHLLSGV